MSFLPQYHLTLLALTSIYFVTACGSPSDKLARSESQIVSPNTDEYDLYPFKVLKTGHLLPNKASFDVVLEIEGAQLPTESQIAAISNHLKSTLPKHDKTFVVFYLPEMEIDAGGWAFAHHTPDLMINCPDCTTNEEPKEGVARTEVPSLHPFEVEINFSFAGKDTRPLVIGMTNLPDETYILVSVFNETSNFLAQDKAQVVAGKFSSGPFGPKTGLPEGKYEVDVTVPIASTQQSHVASILGGRGENLQGPHVVEDEIFGKVVESKKLLTW